MGDQHKSKTSDLRCVPKTVDNSSLERKYIRENKLFFKTYILIYVFRHNGFFLNKTVSIFCGISKMFVFIF